MRPKNLRFSLQKQRPSGDHNFQGGAGEKVRSGLDKKLRHGFGERKPRISKSTRNRRTRAQIADRYTADKSVFYIIILIVALLREPRIKQEASTSENSYELALNQRLRRIQGLETRHV